MYLVIIIKSTKEYYKVMRTSDDNDPLQMYFRELHEHPVIPHERVLVLGKTIEEEYEKIAEMLLCGKDFLTGCPDFEKIRAGESVLLEDRDAFIATALEFLEIALAQSDPASDSRHTLPEILVAVREACESIRRAKNEIAEGNLRFVIKVAKNYQGHGLSLSDLIEEGNVGLMRAVDLYDYRRGYTFLTYAAWWIRQRIARAIANTGATIRLPIWLQKTMRDLAVAEYEFLQERGHAPSNYELGEKLQWDPKRVNAARRAATTYTLSLNYTNDSGTELGSYVEDENAPDPSATAEENEAISFVREEVLPEMSAESRRVLEVRLGIGGGVPHSLDESAVILGIDPEYPYGAPSPDTIFRSEVRALVETSRIVMRKRGISMSASSPQSIASFLPHVHHGSPEKRAGSPRERVEEALERLRHGDDRLMQGVIKRLGFSERHLRDLAVDGEDEQAFQEAWNAALALTAKRYRICPDEILSREWRRDDAARQGFIVVLHIVLGYSLSRIAAILGCTGYIATKYWRDYCDGIREKPGTEKK